jgi:hypothetical protein
MAAGRIKRRASALRFSVFGAVGHQLVEVGHLIKQDPGTSFAALRMTAVRAMRREQATAGATADPSTAAAKCAAFAQDDNFVVSCEL